MLHNSTDNSGSIPKFDIDQIVGKVVVETRCD